MDLNMLSLFTENMSVIMDASEEFYKDTKDVPLELFMSAVAMLIERKCADCDADVIEIMENMLTVAKKINEELGPTDWR